jgi:hypothetical protein
VDSLAPLIIIIIIIIIIIHEDYATFKIKSDSKLLAGFPWPIIFKPETTK